MSSGKDDDKREVEPIDNMNDDETIGEEIDGNILTDKAIDDDSKRPAIKTENLQENITESHLEVTPPVINTATQPNNPVKKDDKKDKKDKKNKINKENSGISISLLQPPTNPIAPAGYSPGTVTTTEPYTDATKKKTEASKPAVETSKPAVETSKTAVETSKTAVEETKPVVEEIKNVTQLTTEEAILIDSYVNLYSKIMDAKPTSPLDSLYEVEYLNISNPKVKEGNLLENLAFNIISKNGTADIFFYKGFKTKTIIPKDKKLPNKYYLTFLRIHRSNIKIGFPMRIEIFENKNAQLSEGKYSLSNIIEHKVGREDNDWKPIDMQNNQNKDYFFPLVKILTDLFHKLKFNISGNEIEVLKDVKDPNAPKIKDPTKIYKTATTDTSDLKYDKSKSNESEPVEGDRVIKVSNRKNINDPIQQKTTEKENTNGPKM